VQSGWRCTGFPSSCSQVFNPVCSMVSGMMRVTCPNGGMAQCAAANTPFAVCLNGSPTCCSSGAVGNGFNSNGVTCGIGPRC
jgi:hypothetical protein